MGRVPSGLGQEPDPRLDDPSRSRRREPCGRTPDQHGRLLRGPR
ncbi:hypothetical protein Rumeso_01984 [Rubellimicrobium mesophilum DSM 19309]|uniref:Uncharacterized protein n=1 Tax=Rubellimicrobium mesophilum DSM 19309 TaxID=442562 RepID=A0A017HPX5_9RHOB|nr:hypothetical protein Rumeso_01984 [Rubellimicrobium mesophilum DSM 19309]